MALDVSASQVVEVVEAEEVPAELPQEETGEAGDVVVGEGELASTTTEVEVGDVGAAETLAPDSAAAPGEVETSTATAETAATAQVNGAVGEAGESDTSALAAGDAAPASAPTGALVLLSSARTHSRSLTCPFGPAAVAEPEALIIDYDDAFDGSAVSVAPPSAEELGAPLEPKRSREDDQQDGVGEEAAGGASSFFTSSRSHSIR